MLQGMDSLTDAKRVTTTNSDPRAADLRTIRAGSLPLYRVNLPGDPWRRTDRIDIGGHAA